MELYRIDPGKKPSQLSPLVLAYVGDSVYEVYVRTRLISQNPDLPAHKLHVMATGFVKAHAQSASMAALEEQLSPEEQAIYKRGRNAKSPTVPKHAEIADYRRATGFEALVGWLFLCDHSDRLNEIMSLAYENALK